MRVLMTETSWNSAILAHNLRQAKVYVTEAGDGSDLLEHACGGEQNAIIVDLDTPDMAASDLVARLRADHPRQVILVMGRDVSPEQRVRMLQRGADDVMSWPDRAHEVIARLRAHVRRAAGFARSQLDLGAVQVDIESQLLTFEGEEVKLTRLEYELMEMLALRNGALVTRDQIMLQLYAWTDEPDPKIIDVYICRIRSKLAAMGATEEVLVTNFGQGVRLAVTAPRRRDAQVA